VIKRKDIFDKRREGALDEAYRMALKLMSEPDIDEWDKKAFAWCLIDLIKRDTKTGQRQNIQHYGKQLIATDCDPNDEILQNNIRYVLSLCNPYSELISQAKTYSKQGDHFEAVKILKKAHSHDVNDANIQTSLAWELYKLSKGLLTQTNPNLNDIKKNLNEYLQLEVEKPSLLHSCFLQLASKLAGDDRFNMLIFVRLWDLNYLRQDDYNRFTADNGKIYSALAEKVIQQASKEAANSNNHDDQKYILPYLDNAINQFPENIWLKLNKAKILIALSENDDALVFGLEVVKSKIKDYWAWELLGNIIAVSDPNGALSCYCKALLCSSDDKFTGKVRLKLALHMIESGDLAKAKYEIQRIVKYRENEKQKIPEDIIRLTSQPWYLETKVEGSNKSFYKANAKRAEYILSSDIKWTNANLGSKFIVPKKEHKPKRKLFVETSSLPLEVNVSESEFNFHDFNPGDAFKIKGEFDNNNKFLIYTIEKRDSETMWDLFSEKIGIVDHVNKNKKLIHFIVDKNIDGIVHFSDLTSSFHEGDAIAVKLSKYTSKEGVRYSVLKASATSLLPCSSLRKQFTESVRADSGMGFTSNDIFIPPPLMKTHHIEDGDEISGIAILNYNKKRSSWGWKAVSIAAESTHGGT